MSMEESILNTVKLYNTILGFNQEPAVYQRFIGKILMYEDVTGKHITYDIDGQGRITNLSFEERRWVDEL